MNEAEHTAGRIYLYESEAAVQAWMAGPTVTVILVNPVLSDIDARTFYILESHTKTRSGGAGTGYCHLRYDRRG